MKKNTIFIAIVASALLIGCSKEQISESQSGKSTVITVSIDDQTKTTIGDLEGGKRSLFWTDGDQIRINGLVSNPLTGVEPGAKKADFKFSEAPSTPYNTLYPAAYIGKDETTVTLPAEAEDLPVPMAAQGLALKPLTGVLKIAVKKGDSDARIVKVQVTSTAQLSGDFTLDYATGTLTGTDSSDKAKTVTLKCDKYLTSESQCIVFIPVPAGTYGFTVKVVDENGSYMTKSTSAAKTVTAGKIMALEAFDYNPSKITTAEEFIAMLATPQTETCDTTYVIMNDIDFTGHVISTTNLFSGNFYATIDGQGYKFTNYTATAPMIDQLVGTVKDITIESGSITLEPDHSCGAFFRQIQLDGAVENLINKVDLTGTVSTTSTFHQGAICGICRGYMKGCKNYGNVTIHLTQNKKSYHYRFGGIVGTAAPSDDTPGPITIEDCENNGAIEVKCVSAKAATYIGGIAGIIDGKGAAFIVSGCSNKGRLTMTEESSGGYVSSTAKAYVGGVVGQRNEGDIKNCSNTGEIDLTALNYSSVVVGGIVAFQKAGFSGETFQGCSVNANIKASYVNSSSTTANPLAYTGMVIGNVGDAGVSYGSASDKITVGGALYNGSTEIKVSAGNVQELAIGSACSVTPTFNLKVE